MEKIKLRSDWEMIGKEYIRLKNMVSTSETIYVLNVIDKHV
jgi:hypothetical protein